MSLIHRAHSQPTEDVAAGLPARTRDEPVCGPEKGHENADRDTQCDGVVVTALVTTTQRPSSPRKARCPRGAQGGSG